ncbi:MAG: serine hydrolase domain-containing protein, partial [Xenococcaceae cyanobacterium MO_188.B32]|nr:serine hydrolase domain-containing protein [Xenococcaceae cyanobacterium MO_188.B32]
EILHKEVQGVHKADSDEKASLDDRFHLGSNAKAMLSFVAAKMVEENQIYWKTKFFDLFPELKAEAKRDYHNITLQDLLSHRSKVWQLQRTEEFMEVPEHIWSDDEETINVELIEWVLQQEPVNLENATFAYSNAGYSMAAMMLEKVSQKPWRDLIQEHIGNGLGLDIDFGWPNEKDEHQPWGHGADENGKLVPVKKGMEDLFLLPPELKPAGDVNIEIMDYAKWLQMHLRGLRGEDNYISSESYHHLHFGLDAYALGWGNFEFDEQNHLSGHQGSDLFFLAKATILPEKDLAFFILTNVGDSESVDYLNAKILQKYDKKWYLLYTL